MLLNCIHYRLFFKIKLHKVDLMLKKYKHAAAIKAMFNRKFIILSK